MGIPRRSSRLTTMANVTENNETQNHSPDPTPVPQSLPEKRSSSSVTTNSPKRPNISTLDAASTSTPVVSRLQVEEKEILLEEDEEEEEEEENEEEEEEESEEDTEVEEPSSEDEDTQVANTNPVLATINLGEPDLLDCPICTEPLSAPVFQCDNGHWACQSCCKKIRYKCSCCSLPIGYNRNRAIERVVQSATASCVNLEYGCLERISYLKKLEHEKTCKYIPITCTSQGCKSIVMPKCFYGHVRKMHNSYTSTTLNTVSKIHLKDQDHALLLATDEKLVFVLRRIVDRSLGSFINVCIAPTASDKRFSFELTVKKNKDAVSLKTAVELTTSYFVPPDKGKCLLIPKDFHAIFDTGRYQKLELEIVVRKVG